MNQKKKTVKLCISAQIHKMSINKNIKFLTKIIWKRHTNKKQTSLVQHEHGFSIFNQKLTLDINILFDQETQLFEDKNTQFVVVIEYEGKVKSGGFKKYNIAQILNQNLKNQMQTLPLSQCPDQNAFIQITFDHQIAADEIDCSMSALNVSSRDFNMSRIDFNDDKLSLEITRINATVNKLSELSKNVKDKQNLNMISIPKLKTTIQILQGEVLTLKKQLEKAQKHAKIKQEQFKSQKMMLLKQISQLEKSVLKKQKQIKSKQLIQIEDKQIKINKSDKKDSEYKKNNDYKKLYEEALEQIKQLTQLNLHNVIRQNDNFNEGPNQINPKYIVNDNKCSQKQHKINKQSFADQSQQIKILKQMNQQLQQNIAEMSFKVAALFNASFQYGGPTLLDHLQNSIGLIQKNT